MCFIDKKNNIWKLLDNVAVLILFYYLYYINSKDALGIGVCANCLLTKSLACL